MPHAARQLPAWLIFDVGRKMTRTKAIVLGIVCVLFIAVFFARESGNASLHIRDVSKKEEVSVRAPLLPFRSGALRVHAKGSVDGTARLHIHSNHDRDYRAVDISGSVDGEVLREAEAWVDTLRVVYEPITAKRGELVISLACGR